MLVVLLEGHSLPRTIEYDWKLDISATTAETTQT